MGPLGHKIKGRNFVNEIDERFVHDEITRQTLRRLRNDVNRVSFQQSAGRIVGVAEKSQTELEWIQLMIRLMATAKGSGSACMFGF